MPTELYCTELKTTAIATGEKLIKVPDNTPIISCVSN